MGTGHLLPAAEPGVMDSRKQSRSLPASVPSNPVLVQHESTLPDRVSPDRPWQQPPPLGVEGAGEEMAWLFSSWWFSPGCLPRTQAQRCRAQPCQAMWLVKGGCLPLLSLERVGAWSTWGPGLMRGRPGVRL